MLKQSVNILVLICIVFFISNCSGEPQRGPRQSPDEAAAEMKEQLGLSDEQTEKIERILRESREKMREERDSFSGSREEMFEHMREMRQENDRLIEELLNDEQKEKYQQYKDSRRQNRRNRNRDR